MTGNQALLRAEATIARETRRIMAERAADQAAAHCPAAKRIIARNRVGRLHGGMLGGMEAMVHVLGPGAAKCRAAECILALRINRRTLIRQGRPHAGADAAWLARAAASRRLAAERVARDTARDPRQTHPLAAHPRAAE